MNKKLLIPLMATTISICASAQVFDGIFLGAGVNYNQNKLKFDDQAKQ